MPRTVPTRDGHAAGGEAGMLKELERLALTLAAFMAWALVVVMVAR